MTGRSSTPGGSSLNTVRAANHQLNKSNGGRTAFIGCIGKDEAGSTLVRELEKVNITGVFAISEDTGTGMCAVLVNGKERTLCANIGASAKYPTQHLIDNMAYLEASQIIYSSGFFITSNSEALRKICKFAAENDKVFGFNLSAPFVLEFYSEDVKFAIEHSDYVFCNEHEASSYAKMHNLDSEDRIGAAKHIASSKKVNQKRQRVSIITVGSLPVIIAIGQPDSKEAEVHTVEVPKIDKDLLVDTNGAGDSFVGGFMAALS